MNESKSDLIRKILDEAGLDYTEDDIKEIKYLWMEGYNYGCNIDEALKDAIFIWKRKKLKGGKE